MKKIVFLSLVALCLPWGLMAQGVVDDLYYVPSKKEKAKPKKDTRETVVVTDADQVVVKSNSPQSVRATAGGTTVPGGYRKVSTRGTFKIQAYVFRSFHRMETDAGVAHLVERHLAKVEVASSSLVTCSKNDKRKVRPSFYPYGDIAKW